MFIEFSSEIQIKTNLCEIWSFNQR